MTDIIPRDLIKHLEWEPGKKKPKRTKPSPKPEPNNLISTIEVILKGKTFYDINLPTALRNAQEYATSEGIIATMPELIQAKIKAAKKHDFWKQWYTVQTEENVGIDRKGLFVSKNKPVIVIVHGEGILTPDRIQQAYDKGLTPQSAAKYTKTEFTDLLNGKLPDGKIIQLYEFKDIKEGITDLPRQYGIIMNFKTAKATNSGWHKKKKFIENPLAIARAGGPEHLEEYYNKAKDSSGDVGCGHRFDEINPNQSQGRLLFLINDYSGLLGNNNLGSIGRFVGVAPEARRAKK